MTYRELLARLARYALWLTIGILLIRGIGDYLTPPAPIPPAHAATTTPRPAWPDDAARTFTQDFTRAYLTDTPDPTTALQPFTSLDLASNMTPQVAHHQTVQTTTIAGITTRDHTHALITVQATLNTRTTVYLTVPIAHNTDGRLAVYDLPSLAPAPQHGTAEPPTYDPLPTNLENTIEDVLTRFFHPYLAGDTNALTYLEPPGTQIAALPVPHTLSGPVVARQITRHGDRLTVQAELHAHGPDGTLPLHYTVLLVHRDRWYVEALNP
jgi:hypothetical protein